MDVLEKLGRAEEIYKLGYNSGYRQGWADAIAHIRESLDKARTPPEQDVWPDRRDLPGYPEIFE